MIALLIAQFLSALADNILLFVILGMIKQQALPDWVTPLLQEAFLIAYIVLAPFVGALADSYAKKQVMLVSNTLKFLAVLYLFSGGNAFIAYGLVGVGACIYSPAKYGILKEIKGESFLVKANAMMESSTIAAILLGVVLGGFLADIATAKNSFSKIILLISGIYLTASISNLLIPKTTAQHKKNHNPWALLRLFIADFKTLFSDISAKMALMGTSLFFGIGATLRFWLIAWVPAALQISDNKTPALLNAVVAVGIVIGSVIASRIELAKAYRVISAGIGMGIGTILISMTQNLHIAYVLLVITGLCGGLFLVPLNALLQKQGHQLIGGGHAVAIQNFVENITMLIMLSLYLGLSKTGLSAIAIGFIFGGLIVILMLSLRFYAHKKHTNP